MITSYRKVQSSCNSKWSFFLGRLVREEREKLPEIQRCNALGKTRETVGVGDRLKSVPLLFGILARSLVCSISFSLTGRCY